MDLLRGRRSARGSSGWTTTRDAVRHAAPPTGADVLRGNVVRLPLADGERGRGGQPAGRRAHLDAARAGRGVPPGAASRRPARAVHAEPAHLLARPGPRRAAGERLPRARVRRRRAGRAGRRRIRPAAAARRAPRPAAASTLDARYGSFTAAQLAAPPEQWDARPGRRRARASDPRTSRSARRRRRRARPAGAGGGGPRERARWARSHSCCTATCRGCATTAAGRSARSGCTRPGRRRTCR